MATLYSRRQWWWAAWVVVALLLLDVLDLTVYGIVVPLSALALATLVPPVRPPEARPHAQEDSRRDLFAIAVFYLVVVVLFRLAFTVFTTAHTAGLFLCFAAGLLVGVVGPVVYTVRVRRAPLRDLGLRWDNWRRAVPLALVFAAVQYALTLYGYAFPRPVDWLPMLVMALVVGLFEAVFFRGFVQERLVAAWGPVAGIGGAAGLYAVYHLGYGMAGTELVFLFGLGVVYAVAFAVVRSVFVLWPLLTPLGSLYNNLASGEIKLPWASIAGFVDVAVVMVAAIVWAARYRRRHPPAPVPLGGARAGGAAGVPPRAAG